jgi:DNA ligase-1
MWQLPPKPMLAKTLDESQLTFPCFVQPKLNGIRCLWDGRTAWARSGLPHPEHIQRLLASIQWPHGVLDGELMLPIGHLFEEVQSAVASEGPLSSQLTLETFDCIPPSPIPFRDRVDLLGDRGIETSLVRSETQLESAMDRFLAAGYEGLIARDPRGHYEAGYSNHLLKYKRFEDAEFPVVEVLEAEGKDQGTALLVCGMPDGQTFRVRPSGSRAVRSKMWKDRLAWLGRPYTVRFQGYTAYGLPRNAVGVAERTDIRWVMAFQV